MSEITVRVMRPGDQDRLMALIGQKVVDNRVLALIASFLEQGVLDGDREWTPEQGTPQGAVVAP